MGSPKPIAKCDIPIEIQSQGKIDAPAAAVVVLDKADNGNHTLFRFKYICRNIQDNLYLSHDNCSTR